MSSQTTAIIIRTIGVFTILSGAVVAFAGVSDFTGINDIFLSIASSGTDGVAGLTTPEAKLGFAIAGGVFAGLGAMYLFITAPGVEQSNEIIRKGTIYVFLTWFIIDSSASVASGNTPNIIPNVVFLIIFLLPLVLVKRSVS